MVGLHEPDKVVHKSGRANVPAGALRALPVTPATASTPSEPTEGFDSCEKILFTERLNDGAMAVDRPYSKMRKFN